MIITVWVTALTTTSDGRDKFRGCKGKKSSPLQQGHSTVCAAQRTVRSNLFCRVFPGHHNVESFGLGKSNKWDGCALAFASGEVYTWGDNDEGQLGDGTTNAIQRPRLVAALQGKKINRVACGSAHTLAWSTSKPTNAGKLPAQVSSRIKTGPRCSPYHFDL